MLFNFNRRQLTFLILTCATSFIILGLTFIPDLQKRWHEFAWVDLMENQYSERIRSLIFKNDQSTFNFFTTQDDFDNSKGAGFLIDTPGCRIPKLDPWDPSVKKLIRTFGAYKCKRGYPVFLKPFSNGSIILDAYVMKRLGLKPSDLVCNYQGIERLHETKDSKREVHYRLKSPHPFIFGEVLEEDHVKVNCRIRKWKKFEHFFPLTRLKESVERGKPSSSDRPNVILLGIDSISRLNFLRQFPETQSFLQTYLVPFDMKGYTKVGENSFPNLVPLLTGNFPEVYYNDSMRNSMFWDDVDLIWKLYAKKGYRTFYAEDMPIYGTFQYEKRGFYNPPTDYYYRPLALAIQYSKLRETSDWFCLNSQMEFELMYKYLENFVETMGPRPYFAFSMVSALTHDNLNYAGYADRPTAAFLKRLFETGTLNKTVMVIFSDHGIRFGKIRETYIGKIEERMPFMFVHFPKLFLRDHPEAAANLQVNQERLMTFFDVHRTLLHLLNLKGGENDSESSSHGVSLMDEISENRTCTDANIRPHWCPCQIFQSVPLGKPLVTTSAQAIISNINEQLEAYKDLCEFLEIDTITDARVGQVDNLVLRFQKQIRKTGEIILGEEISTLPQYMVTFTAKPGGGMFEGTVQVNNNTNTFTVLGISRINMYNNQSYCIDVHRLKIFCYCSTF